MNEAEILRDYKVLRRASRAMNDRLAKMLERDEMTAAAAALDMLLGKVISFETEDEVGVLMDYAIHNIFRNGHNAVDRMLGENPPPQGSPELRVLQSMQKSHYTMFEVLARIPGLGVSGLDGPKKTPIVIVDVGFSATADVGMTLASRILSPGDGWWMTTGAALPVNKPALNRIVGAMNSHKRRFAAEPTEQERTTMIIRACIASGASQQISYADVPSGGAVRAAEPVVRDSPKVGRNDVCPCGSGKKSKKCCGS